MVAADKDGGLGILCEPLSDWFRDRFPDGPTPAQSAAWPVFAAGEHALIIAPTGTGKTLAGFLGVIDRLLREHLAGVPASGLRCVYISPLRSLGYDVERNLVQPLSELRDRLGLSEPPISVGVRTGDTSPTERRRLSTHPPHILITTPESLSLLLSQSAWLPRFAGVEAIIVDEVHALISSKRGADLTLSLERLAGCCRRDPVRVGLSATCRPAATVARFLVGNDRSCRVLEPPLPACHQQPVIHVESLIQDDEALHRGLTYRRLLTRLVGEFQRCRTTLIFANTRPFTERLTHDLRQLHPDQPDAYAAHHSSLDPARRREVESALKAGAMRAVVSSTSLELGIDIGTADLSVLVGLPGSVARCLQRVGRAGHRVGAAPRGLLLASSAAELTSALVLARAAREGRLEPTSIIRAPLDVLCQQLIGMACAGECEVEAVERLVRRAAPYADLTRADLDTCLDFLAGDLAAPAGAWEPEPGATPRWTAPRIWRSRGLFGIRNARVVRWFRRNVGTITSEESVRVQCENRDIGTIEGSYAERLAPGDRFVLDGRALEFRRLEGLTLHARPTAREPFLPIWHSDRRGLSTTVAAELCRFRAEAAAILASGGPEELKPWLARAYQAEGREAAVVVALLASQLQQSVIPPADAALIEQWPTGEGHTCAVHVPLGYRACEALARAVAARLGRRRLCDLKLVVADLGFSLQLATEFPLQRDEIESLFLPVDLEADILEGLDHGDLLSRRFRHIAATSLMVLRNPEGGRPRVGGLLWVSQRLFPLVRAACPDHPLLRETRREVLEDLLDATAAAAWLRTRPTLLLRTLEAPSPFASAWIDPSGPEPLRYEPPGVALKRLHARIVGTAP